MHIEEFTNASCKDTKAYLKKRGQIITETLKTEFKYWLVSLVMKKTTIKWESKEYSKKIYFMFYTFLFFRTKIFIRRPQTLFQTEDAFQLKKHDLASIIQASWKGLMQRRRYLKMKESAIIMQKYIRRFLAIRQAQKRRKAANVIRR